MVKDVSAKKTKIDTVIDDYGTSITVTPISSENYDEDTGWSTSSGTSFATTVVPYDVFTPNMDFRDMGNLKEGDIRLIAKGDVTFAEKETFTYDGKTWIIRRINPLPLAGIVLAQVIDASEQLA